MLDTKSYCSSMCWNLLHKERNMLRMAKPTMAHLLIAKAADLDLEPSCACHSKTSIDGPKDMDHLDHYKNLDPSRCRWQWFTPLIPALRRQRLADR